MMMRRISKSRMERKRDHDLVQNLVRSRLKVRIVQKVQNQDRGLDHGIAPGRGPSLNRSPGVGLVLDLVPESPEVALVLALLVRDPRDPVQLNLVPAPVPALVHDLVQSLVPARRPEHLPAPALKVERDLASVPQVEGLPGPVLKPAAMVQEQVPGQVHVPHLGQASDPRGHPRGRPVPHPSLKLQAPRHLLGQVLEETPALEVGLTGQEVDLEVDLGRVPEAAVDQRPVDHHDTAALIEISINHIKICSSILKDVWRFIRAM